MSRPASVAAVLAAALAVLLPAASAAPAPVTHSRIAPAASLAPGTAARPAVPGAVVRRLERRAGRALSSLRRWRRVPARAPLPRPGFAPARPAPPPAICRIPPPGGWPPVVPERPTPDLSAYQDHRAGLALPPGALGAGVTIADVEYDWRPGHEELAARGLTAAPPAVLDPAFLAAEHGTAVLALLGAPDDGRGVSGIVPAAALRPRTPFSASGAYELPLAIATAAAALAPGDVLLVEQQIFADADPDPDAVRRVLAPVEADPFSRDAVAAAVAAGLTVVEPAGNQGEDLARLARPWLTAAPGEPGHTGALVVGSGGSGLGPSAELATGVRSGFGRRVDLQGYGEGVVTAGYGDPWSLGGDRAYTACFDGTSSAAATVAGAVAALQGIARARTDGPLGPAAVRAALVATGLPQPPGETRPVGPRPQVAAAALTIPASPPLP